eukprot:gene15425-20809_t
MLVNQGDTNQSGGGNYQNNDISFTSQNSRPNNTIQGWVMKKSPSEKRNKWKRRYAYICEYIIYFAVSPYAKPNKIVDLRFCSTIRTTELVGAIISQSVTHSIELNFEQEVILFFSESDSKFEWIRSIQNLLCKVTSSEEMYRVDFEQQLM